ncbi:serine hydrolase [Chitinispirillales bacterium ANBcel5]|uniref:serine hydrolase domain-containing protein n=1 Tax=Cellulosispirillum alkaliphilum TaxID=3039283 RepID=UPI002A5862FD|nr:serine hydrolase [Chitinispirillales bacterium ANBcel5]
MLEQIRSCLNKAVEEKVFPGCVLAVEVSGKQHLICAGNYTYQSDSPEMTADSVFDCASITKAIPTSSLALKMVDQGLISLDEQMIKFIPEYRGNYRDQITIAHLLTQTLNSDLRLSALKNSTAQQILDAIFSQHLKTPPGKSFCYTNSTSILLGIVVERVWGKGLHELAAEQFFEPLEMKNTTFFPEKLKKERIVPTEIDPWRGRVIQGEIHDESAWILRSLFTAGSAGLFSTAPDLLKFCKMLLNGGNYGTKHFFSHEMVGKMHIDQLPHIDGIATGLGWELDQEYMGSLRSRNTIGKTGFTGTVVICDTTKQCALVLLSNYTWPKRKADRSKIHSIRSQIADYVFKMA